MIRRVGHQGSHFALGQAWFVQVHRVMDDWRHAKTHPRVYFWLKMPFLPWPWHWQEKRRRARIEKAEEKTCNIEVSGVLTKHTVIFTVLTL